MTPVGSGTNLPGAVITRTEKVIRGSFYGSVHPQRDFPMFLDMYRNGKLMLDELVTRRYSLDEINEAYQHMLTGEVARDWGIRDRGTLEAGRAADVVIFDADRVAITKEEFVDDFPGEARRYVRRAEGFDRVLVNGEVVYGAEGYTDARPGKIV